MRIPLFRPVISDEAMRSVCDVLRSGWIGLGPKTMEFEAAFADYIGVDFCVGLNSCTAALHLGLKLLDVPAGSEVITSALTFVSTNHVILYEGLKPVFADIDPETGNMDAASAASLTNEHTGALMLMHYGGCPCDIDDFYSLADERGIPIVEDCAHACGAVYKDRRVGSHGEIHAFSFHAVKNLTTGDGGALTVKSERYRDRLARLRWLGIDRDTFARNARAYKWDYDVRELGYKYHMNDIEAAIGIAQLKLLDSENARRAGLAAMYRKELGGIPGIKLLKQKDDRVSSNHLFCVLAEDRDALIEKLAAEGVDTGVHYRRNDHYAMFEERELPKTEYFWRRAVSLPMHLMLSERDVEYIAGVIKKGW